MSGNMPAGCSVADLDRAFQDVLYTGDDCKICGNRLEVCTRNHGECCSCSRKFCKACAEAGTKSCCEECKRALCPNCSQLCEFCLSPICPGCVAEFRTNESGGRDYICISCREDSRRFVAAVIPELQATLYEVLDGAATWTDELADRLERIARQVRDRSAA